MVRPSFVLGGRGMAVLYDEKMLREYVAAAVGVTPDRPLLLDRFLHNAMECEADAVSDGVDVYIPSVMEHIEQAGVHSGDSACLIPPQGIGEENLEKIRLYTKTIAHELGVCGLMNVQYAIEEGRVYVLEANPRASRTVPLVSKVCGISLAAMATEVMLGRRLREMSLPQGEVSYVGVKQPVFPFDKFPEVDPVLGPEMRSTGEVLGMADNLGLAFFKAQEGAGARLPRSGAVLVSLSEKPEEAVLVAEEFYRLGFKLYGTEGTASFLSLRGVPTERVDKINQGRPNVLDLIVNREVSLVINTPSPRRDSLADDASIRKAAIKYGVPYMTTLAAAHASALGIAAARRGGGGVRSLQEYHRELK